MINSTDKPKPLLPPGFQFSQGSLQAYMDCPRLFQLRYIQKVSWPALEAERSPDDEDYLKQGIDFHHMIHQNLIGLTPGLLEHFIENDSRLARWWQNFLDYPPVLEHCKIYPEFALSIPQDDYRLVAKFDLFAVSVQPDIEPSNESIIATIFDWKTSRQRPKQSWLKARLQSRVYPYVLVNASENLLDGISLVPEQIMMTYWFSNFPATPISIVYSPSQFKADGKLIGTLINQIKQIGTEDAPKTNNTNRCRFCGYRSLCDRGTTAGSFEEEMENGQSLDDLADFSPEFDFNQIAEIDF